MKACKINLDKRNKAFETIGIALIVALFVAAFIDDKLTSLSFVVIFLIGTWLLLIGVCND